MNLRDLKHNVIKRLAEECDEDFNRWFQTTNGVNFADKKPIAPRDIWRLAFSKGASAILRRVDHLKEQ